MKKVDDFTHKATQFFKKLKRVNCEKISNYLDTKVISIRC